MPSGETTHGVYVYGIVPADVAVTDTAKGVGEPPAKVHLVRYQDIAALASDVDVNQPLGRPEDLLAHERLLDGAAAEAPVLPFRFGAVLQTEQAAEDERPRRGSGPRARRAGRGMGGPGRVAAPRADGGVRLRVRTNAGKLSRWTCSPCCSGYR
jgi:hypothetical protein